MEVELAEMLRELLSADPDLPSYQDTIDRAEALVAEAIKRGIIVDDEIWQESNGTSRIGQD